MDDNSLTQRNGEIMPEKATKASTSAKQRTLFLFRVVTKIMCDPQNHLDAKQTGAVH